jgi:hypothetical protein
MLAVVRRSGRFFLAIGLLLAAVRLAFPQNSQSLKEILTAEGLPLSGAKLANVEKKITRSAQLDDSKQFAIAYYLDDGSGMLNPPLLIDRYDKTNKQWRSGALPDAQTDSPSMDDTCFGSVLNMRALGGRLFLDTHINPSAGCLLVLSPDLKLEASLYGWLVGQLGPDLLLYQRSEVHFAPVHPTEIALYDLRSKRDETIFPPKAATAVRQARIAQLREFYKPNTEWCRENDDPCDPESFDSDLEGEVATNESESAVAFLISYEQIQFVQGDLQKPSGPKDVLYVYRRLSDPAKMEFREMPWSDEKTQFGDVPLQKLLQPETLKRIFSEPPLKKP